MVGLLNMLVRVLISACRPRHDLVLENLALRHQLEVLARARPKPRLRAADRVLWVWLRRAWPSGWARHLTIVRPETVIGWHRQAGACIGAGGRELGWADLASARRSGS